MHTQKFPTQPARKSARSHLTAAALVTLALVSAACSDPAALDTSDPLFHKSGSTGGSTTTASGFTVLANAAVTCTDGTIIGNVGTFLATPAGSITQTTCPISSGTAQVGTTASIAAFNAFLTSYAALAPKTGDVCTVLSGTLAGMTLAPGNYCYNAAATLTGVLTLRGPATGVWNFKIGTVGTGALTGTSLQVIMAGGAQPCNVTWWVAQAATMTDSRFSGTILAGAAITLTRGTFTGNAYSKADVTVTGTALTGCAGGKVVVKDQDQNKHHKFKGKHHRNGHNDHGKGHKNDHDNRNDHGNRNDHDDNDHNKYSQGYGRNDDNDRGHN